MSSTKEIDDKIKDNKKQASSSKELPYKVNDQVQVEARTWAGICDYGGAGSVKKCYYDENGIDGPFVDVQYTTGGSRIEKRIEVVHVSPLVYLSRTRRTPKPRDITNLTGKEGQTWPADSKTKKKRKNKSSSSTSTKKSKSHKNTTENTSSGDKDKDKHEVKDKDLAVKKIQSKTDKNKSKFVIYEDNNNSSSSNEKNPADSELDTSKKTKLKKKKLSSTKTTKANNKQDDKTNKTSNLKKEKVASTKVTKSDNKTKTSTKSTIKDNNNFNLIETQQNQSSNNNNNVPKIISVKGKPRNKIKSKIIIDTSNITNSENNTVPEQFDNCAPFNNFSSSNDTIISLKSHYSPIYSPSTNIKAKQTSKKESSSSNSTPSTPKRFSFIPKQVKEKQYGIINREQKQTDNNNRNTINNPPTSQQQQKRRNRNILTDLMAKEKYNAGIDMATMPHHLSSYSNHSHLFRKSSESKINKSSLDNNNKCTTTSEGKNSSDDNNTSTLQQITATTATTTTIATSSEKKQSKENKNDAHEQEDEKQKLNFYRVLNQLFLESKDSSINIRNVKETTSISNQMINSYLLELEDKDKVFLDLKHDMIYRI